MNIFFRHVVIKQDSDGHHGRGPGGDRRVHEDDVVVLDVFRKPEVVQFGLPGLRARLECENKLWKILRPKKYFLDRPDPYFLILLLKI